MLSDSLFDAWYKILTEVAWYAEDDKEYPLSQKDNIIMALTHLDMARARFDRIGDEDFNEDEKKMFIVRNTCKFFEAVNNEGEFKF